MIYTIPLQAIPNQKVSTTIDGRVWNILLETRLDHLYATIDNQQDGILIMNRICRNNCPIIQHFFFLDLHGQEDPNYLGLDTRFKLVYTNE